VQNSSSARSQLSVGAGKPGERQVSCKPFLLFVHNVSKGLEAATATAVGEGDEK
jgi:hypothetical protein